MPRLRKPETIMLSDDELYAVFRATLQHPKLPKWKPTDYELGLIKSAHDKISTEYYARAEEDGRIDEELQLIRDEYREDGRYQK
jgi:hypothetical protein